jgi:pimeloyl-ACP methyl ester carboxylesterase
MPTLKTAESEIYFEEYGRGFPVLLFAPGGMRSKIEAWRRNPANPDAVPPWMDPTVALSDRFRVIAMDQRNAGKSRAPVRATDDWSAYKRDHLALLDHLGVERCHVVGGCIGASYALALCQAGPGRVAAAVLQNPIGIANDNRQAFREMFDGWADEIAVREDVDKAALRAFGQNMFDGDFVFSVDRGFVRACNVPMLVLPGGDVFHPKAIAQEIVSLAPAAEMLEDWKGPTFLASTIAKVRDFLVRHTPGQRT